MLRTLSRTLPRTNAASRLTSARGLHLTSTGGAELLGKYLPPPSSSNPDAPPIPFKLFASRTFHVPVLEGTNGNGTATLQLDINSASLPCTDAWLADLGVAPAERERARDTLQGLWDAWRDNDLLRVTGELRGAEPTITKVVADDFALPRQPAVKALGDESLIHPLEQQAANGKLFYHKSRDGGNIGCYGYGAGVAMSTMDLLAEAGGKAANFLDGGGGATVENVQAAVNTVLADKDAEVLFINSFGGLTKMDLIATGLVENLRARKAAGEKLVPVVARLRGTGEQEAAQILAAAKDLDNIEYIADAKQAANRAVELAGKWTGNGNARRAAAVASAAAAPVVFSRDGQYEKTLHNLVVKKGDPVMVLGLGKASQGNCQIAAGYGTNIVGFTVPKKGGQTFIDKPVFEGVREAVGALKPRIASVFVPPIAAADSIIECIEAEIPLIVAYAEGIPQHEQLKVQAALRSQGKSRLVGANCPGVIFPHERVKLGIQPLMVHSPGSVGIVSRSGTISYELAAQTTALGLGQSAVYGLGGDPFPGTRTWEALQLMLEDDKTKVCCVVGEIGGQMEEEAAVVYKDYLASLAPGVRPKPVVGFVAGTSTEAGLVYGHAGAVWWEDHEMAAAKKKLLADAGFVMAPTIGDIGTLLKQEHDKL